MDFRRTWNKEDYAQKASLREANALPKTDAPDHTDVNFESLVNTVQKVQAVDESGFHCRACGENFKDNLNYLDHLNSREHLKRTGQDKIKRATVEDVKRRLSQKKQEIKVLDPKERFQLRLQREMELKMERKQRKKQKPKEEVDQDVMDQMGFGAFGTSKKT
ncbi:hypothetical protein EDD86DRAFT_56230 [Gorgonomyces haynaldii]|nr:hypothetical protein EDD86DRAFT_56230 [Gorgonomyces haynaldii]